MLHVSLKTLFHFAINQLRRVEEVECIFTVTDSEDTDAWLLGWLVSWVGSCSLTGNRQTDRQTDRHRQTDRQTDRHELLSINLQHHWTHSHTPI